MKIVKEIFRYLLGFFWIAAGINHFLNPEFYVNIMPDYVPAHEELVLISGVTEIIAGVLVLVPATAHWGAWFILAHLAIFMTVHIHMIQHADRYADVPLAMLWLRLPLQALFALWAAWYIRPPQRPLAPGEREAPGT